MNLVKVTLLSSNGSGGPFSEKEILVNLANVSSIYPMPKSESIRSIIYFNYVIDGIVPSIPVKESIDEILTLCKG